MDDETTVNVGKTFGERRHAIIESPLVQPLWADTILELIENGGVVYISLGAGVGDFGNPPEVRPVARLRMPLATVEAIRLHLEHVAAAKAEAKKAAN